jgi:hypothetical protein
MKKAIDIATEQAALDTAHQMGEITYDQYTLKLERLKAREEAENDARGFKGIVATLKKLKACPVRRMFDEGKIDSGQYRAAEAIQAGHQIIVSDVSVQQCQYREPIGVMGNAREDETARQFLLVQRYKEWTENIQPLEVEFALALIIEGKSMRKSERIIGIRNGDGPKLLECLLDIYNKQRRKLDRENRAIIQNYA